jgi:heat shock protein HtpX
MAKLTHHIHVIQSPQSQAEAWLVGKVREQAEKAGIAMPEVGIYESPEANAFATGPSRNNALVAVSTGLLQQMRPREVEGVLAHEVSHVANGDMVTMTLLQGTLNTFVVFLSRVLGFALDQALRRGDDDRRGPGMGYFLGSLICQVVLGILASMIVMAYSRRREFRADAMGAQLEGRDAMIGGLRRLKQITESGGVIDNRSASLAAFKINHPTGVMRLFMSHPPLDERIAALERGQ